MDIVDTIWHRPILVWYYFDISLNAFLKNFKQIYIADVTV